MSYDEEFFDNYYNLKLKNRLKFFLLIWSYGKFHSELEIELELSSKESIIKFCKTIQKLGFLSIEKRYNPATFQEENIYFLSNDNFKNIFLHICKKSKVQFNPEAYDLAYQERKNVHPLLDQKIANKLNFDESRDRKELIAILSKNLVFFFLFIMSTSLKIQNNEYFNGLIDLLTENFALNSHELFTYLTG